MFGIGETELVIIVVFAFLLFGPDKLPGMGRTLGRVLRQFKEASDGFTEVVQTNIMDPAAEELQKSPKQRKREEAAESDGGAEGAEGAEAQQAESRRETFAERKARLAAERERQEAEGASAAVASVYMDDEDADIDEDADADGEFFDDDVDSDEDIEEAAPQRTTAADLYAMGGARSSRFHEASAPAAKEPAPEVAGPEVPQEVQTAADATSDEGEGEGA